jgi:hypothetical protein
VRPLNEDGRDCAREAAGQPSLAVKEADPKNVFRIDRTSGTVQRAALAASNAGLNDRASDAMSDLRMTRRRRSTASAD